MVALHERLLAAVARVTAATRRACAAAMITVAGLTCGAPLASSQAAARARGSAPMTVSIDTRGAGTSIPPDFLGLSFEVKGLAQIGSYASKGNLVALMRSLGPGIMRFGGVTADTQVAWSDDGVSAPAWARAHISAADFDGIARLAAETGWRVLLTLNFGHYDPQAALREVLAAHAALGDRLAGVEFGNEPDAYTHEGLRGLPWDFAQYQAQIAYYRAAVQAAAPPVPIIGPDAASGVSRLGWIDTEAVVEQPALLTAHYYPLSWCAGYTPVLSDLLSPGIQRAETRMLSNMAFISSTRGTALRVDETNNISCGGQPGVSNTFASALWAVDYLTRAMQSGIAGVNFHGHVDNPRGYSPLAAQSPDALGSGQLTAQPEWYALLLAHQLLGDRPLAPTVRTRGHHATATAFLSARGVLHVVLVDDQPSGLRPLRVNLQVPRSYAAAAVMRLTGRSRGSTSGVQLGGRTVTSDGAWVAPGSLPLLHFRAGTFTMSMTPSSAALVTVYPRG